MNKLKGTIDVRLTLEEINLLNDLIQRSNARPVKHHEGETSNGEKYNYNTCPACDATVLVDDKFCRECGQAIDTENYEI